MHALHFVPKAAGGRGNKGGLSEYAAAIGKDFSNVAKYRDAAAVAQKVGNDAKVSALLTKAAHLAEISKLPESCWQTARVTHSFAECKILDIIPVSFAKGHPCSNRPSCKRGNPKSARNSPPSKWPAN